MEIFYVLGCLFIPLFVATFCTIAFVWLWAFLTGVPTFWARRGILKNVPEHVVQTETYVESEMVKKHPRLYNLRFLGCLIAPIVFIVSLILTYLLLN